MSRILRFEIRSHRGDPSLLYPLKPNPAALLIASAEEEGHKCVCEALAEKKKMGHAPSHGLKELQFPISTLDGTVI